MFDRIINNKLLKTTLWKYETFAKYSCLHSQLRYVYIRFRANLMEIVANEPTFSDYVRKKTNNSLNNN